MSSTAWNTSTDNVYYTCSFSVSYSQVAVEKETVPRRGNKRRYPSGGDPNSPSCHLVYVSFSISVLIWIVQIVILQHNQHCLQCHVTQILINLDRKGTEFTKCQVIENVWLCACACVRAWGVGASEGVRGKPVNASKIWCVDMNVYGCVFVNCGNALYAMRV